MIMRKSFIIDGENFNTIDGFYNEIENVFTSTLDWEIGRNLNSFNDILRGGFGKHHYGEPILIKWLNYQKSERDLGANTLKAIVETILDINNSGHLEKL